MKSQLVLIGMPGCGKTTVGKRLAKLTNKQFIDLDEYIVQTTGQSIPRLFEKGEEHFRNIETEVCREIGEKKGYIIATGGGVVKRRENMEALRKNGIIVFLDRPLEFIFSDIHTESRPLLKDGKDRLYTLYKERYGLYKKYADEVIHNDKTLQETVEKLIHVMKKHQLLDPEQTSSR